MFQIYGYIVSLYSFNKMVQVILKLEQVTYMEILRCFLFEKSINFLKNIGAN